MTCLECGQSFKQLSLHHLRRHGLDSRSYRARYGIPHAQPLAAKATTARRREVAQEIRLWEKAPRFIKARERTGLLLPDLEVEAAHEAAEEASAVAPAQPKGQRKTSPKKTAGKKRAEG